MHNADQIALEGIGSAELPPDGRIKRIIEFFGTLEADVEDDGW